MPAPHAASRDELIALISSSRRSLAAWNGAAQLEDKAKPGASGMPGLKRSSPKSPAPQQSRKPRPHGFSRRRMAPTHRVEHELHSRLTALHSSFARGTGQPIARLGVHHDVALGGHRGAHPRQPRGPRIANGYGWTFSTPTDRYFLRRGRGKSVVDEVLGDGFAGVLVCISTPPTTITTAPNSCWAHLLRDIHDLQGLYPDDGACALRGSSSTGRAAACSASRATPTGRASYSGPSSAASSRSESAA